MPTWPTDRLRRRTGGSLNGSTLPSGEGSGDAAPSILVGRDGRRRIVVAADTREVSASTRHSVSIAQALVAGLLVDDADPAADAHPVTFLRADLGKRNVATCEVATAEGDSKFVRVAEMVLVRQEPGPAKGLMFITLEDETGVANLVIWPSLCEKQRRLIPTASMMAIEGRLQREGEVVQVVVKQLHDLSGELAGLGEREAAFPLPHGRGDDCHHGGLGADARGQPPRLTRTRDIFIEPNHIDTFKVKARHFRL